VLGVVPLLRAEGCEEESQVGLVLPEDVRPSAETMILPRKPDESLVVDVARGLDSGSMTFVFLIFDCWWALFGNRAAEKQF